VPNSSAELKAIEIATIFIFQQDEQKAVILTDSRTACQILMKAMKGDRHNEIAMRILQSIQNAQKQMTIKLISAHVGLEGNERANREPEMDYSHLKMHTEYWGRRGMNGTTCTC
jgi:ribonuclease HI